MQTTVKGNIMIRTGNLAHDAVISDLFFNSEQAANADEFEGGLLEAATDFARAMKTLGFDIAPEDYVADFQDRL